MTIARAKKTIRQTLRFAETPLAQITAAATRARMSIPDFLVSAALLVIEEKISPRPKPDINIKVTKRKINSKLRHYFNLEETRDELMVMRKKLKAQIHALLPEDNYTLRTFSYSNLEFEQLQHDLHVCEMGLLNPENGYGLLQDVSDALTPHIKLELDEAGTDTHFLLATKMGSVTIPLKIVNGEIWLGGLPDDAVVYLNNRRVGL